MKILRRLETCLTLVCVPVRRSFPQPRLVLRRSSSSLSINDGEFEWLKPYFAKEPSNPDVLLATAAVLPEPGASRGASRSWPGALLPMPPSALPRPPLTGNKHRQLVSNVLPAMSSCQPEEGDEPEDELELDAAGARKRRKVGWTNTEDLTILAAVRRIGTQWQRIADELPSRTADAVRNRWHRLQKTHLLSDTDEGRSALDGLLIASGIDPDWCPPELASPDPSSSPAPETTRVVGADHGRQMWTADEDRIIEDGVRRFGCKWRQIAALLPGRTDSSIRNRWMRLCKDTHEATSAPPLSFGTAVSSGVSSSSSAPALPFSAVSSTPPFSAVSSALLFSEGPPPPQLVATASSSAPQSAAAVSSGGKHALIEYVMGEVHASEASPGPWQGDVSGLTLPGPKQSLDSLLGEFSESMRVVEVDEGMPLGMGAPMEVLDLDSFIEAVSAVVSGRPSQRSSAASFSEDKPRISGVSSGGSCSGESSREVSREVSRSMSGRSGHGSAGQLSARDSFGSRAASIGHSVRGDSFGSPSHVPMGAPPPRRRSSVGMAAALATAAVSATTAAVASVMGRSRSGSTA